MNALVMYFSRAGENYGVGQVAEGNTAVVAKMIAETAGADLFEIAPATSYPGDYQRCTEVAKQEKRAGARPALSAPVPDVAGYDVVFVGYPNWWGDAPMAVYTALEGLDLSGKRVAPFCTHEGSGLGATARNVGRACPGAQMLEGLAIQGRVAQNDRAAALTAVETWLGKLGLAA